MEIKYAYACGKEKAYDKVNNLLESLQKKHKDKISNVYKEWNSSKDNMHFQFNTMGFNISGYIQLKNTELILDGNLPTSAMLFKGKIKKTIESVLDDLFK
jgi:hypothetical protein